ncbi:C2H2-type domain-containing protein [Favolaschia claudopus]|uniref:C2H2-type domain-containing protein n=1 Tax=Favolaschia claudopus TaxID=2862362 RepID=A0AAW0A9R9_9AGAR
MCAYSSAWDTIFERRRPLAHPTLHSIRSQSDFLIVQCADLDATLCNSSEDSVPTMNPWGPNPWAPQAFYQQPGFVPQQTGFPAYWGQPGWAPQNPTPGFHSTKYPNLNPILASDSTQVRYDVRKKARNEISQAIYVPHRGQFATTPPASHVRLICKAFPWSIEVMSNTPVTVEGVWDAIWAALQQPIVDSEWGIIVSDKKLRETIEKAAKKRSDYDGEPKFKRIDWLGSSTIFRGLDKMQDFAEQRVLPGVTEPCLETWVIKLGTS